MSLNEIVKNMESKITPLKIETPKKSGFEFTLEKSLNWQYVFFGMLSLSLIVALIGRRIYIYVNEFKIYNKLGMKFLEIFIYLLVFNFFILTMSTSNYFARVKADGIKGPNGDLGIKGMRGKDAKCDICTKKYNIIKRNTPIRKTLFVDNISSLLTDNDVIPTEWNQTEMDTNDIRFDLERSVSYNTDIKYLIGVICSYNSKTQTIETIQFIKMNNKNNQELLGGRPSGKPVTNKTQQKNFTCPNNFGISKIIVNLGYNNDEKVYVLRGLQIGYSNIKTGRPNDEEFSIGIKNKQSNIISVPYYAGFKEHNNKDYPSFINGISILSNDNFVENIMATHVNTYWDL